MTPIKLTKVSYAQLNARQKENYNFQKISAVLTEYGFVTFRLSDDWAGADFIAVHLSGDVLRVQLKSRLTFEKKYFGNVLYVAFAVGDTWYLFPTTNCFHRSSRQLTLAQPARGNEASIHGRVCLNSFNKFLHLIASRATLVRCRNSVLRLVGREPRERT